MIAELRAADAEHAPEVRARARAFFETLRVQAVESPVPDGPAITLFVRAVYQGGALLGLDCDAAHALTEAAHTAAQRVTIDSARAELDFFASAQGALLAGHCGRPREALAIAERWLAAWPNHARAGFLGVIAGDMARATGDWDAAEKHLVAASQIIPEQNAAERRDLCAAFTKLYLELGLPDVAFAWWQAEDQLVAHSTSFVARSDHVRSLVDLYADTGRIESARDALDKELADEAAYRDHPRERAALEFRLGIALCVGSAKASPEDVRGDALLAKALTDPSLTALDHLHAALARLHTALVRDHDLVRGEERLATAEDIFEEIHPQDERAAWGETVRPPRQWGLLAAYAAQLARERHDPNEVLERHLVVLEASFRDFLAQWRATPMREGGVGFLYIEYRRKLLGELVSYLVTLHGDAGKIDALERIFEAQTCGTLGRRLTLAAAKVDDVRKRLVPSDGGILIFLPSGDVTHVFALDREHLDYDLVASAVELAAAVRARISLSPPADRSAAAAAKTRASLARAGRVCIDELLPAAVRARVAGWRSWLVVGAELLDGVPLEVLSLDGKRLLGLDVALEYLPSVPLGMALAARAPAPRRWTRSLAFVGAPRTTERSRATWRAATPFALSKAEVDGLLAPFGANALRCVDLDATRAALLGLDLADTAILHVLCHGIHDSKRERPAGLLLAETTDGLGEVWSSDLALGPKVVPPLVILSACGAGRGSARLGEDALNHLGGALLERGANCVLLARQEIELRAILALTGELHRRLAAGDPPAEALRAARVALAASDEFGDPFYFATLQAFGLGHARFFAAR
ncbi:MAG: CHAT domain-containing protein [Planctomycetes bacterium]|nr:CHAT domain-containing protein [Planctomycetota bacterium]